MDELLDHGASRVHGADGVLLCGDAVREPAVLTFLEHGADLLPRNLPFDAARGCNGGGSVDGTQGQHATQVTHGLVRRLLAPELLGPDEIRLDLIEQELRGSLVAAICSNELLLELVALIADLSGLLGKIDVRLLEILVIGLYFLELDSQLALRLFARGSGLERLVLLPEHLEPESCRERGCDLVPFFGVGAQVVHDFVTVRGVTVLVAILDLLAIRVHEPFREGEVAGVFENRKVQDDVHERAAKAQLALALVVVHPSRDPGSDGELCEHLEGEVSLSSALDQIVDELLLPLFVVEVLVKVLVQAAVDRHEPPGRLVATPALDAGHLEGGSDQDLAELPDLALVRVVRLLRCLLRFVELLLESSDAGRLSAACQLHLVQAGAQFALVEEVRDGVVRHHDHRDQRSNVDARAGTTVALGVTDEGDVFGEQDARSGCHEQGNKDQAVLGHGVHQ